MTIALRGAILLAACLSLVSCGGGDSSNESTGTMKPESTTDAEPAAKGTNNIFAKEQQLIRDAKGIQVILDKDAEKKKEALKNLD